MTSILPHGPLKQFDVQVQTANLEEQERTVHTCADAKFIIDESLMVFCAVVTPATTFSFSSISRDSTPQQLMRYLVMCWAKISLLELETPTVNY